MPDERDQLIYGARQSLAEAEAELRSEQQAYRDLTNEPPVEILGNHLETIRKLFEKRKSLAGNLVELGVYAGATTVELAKFGRPVYAFDTFEGIPARSYTDGLDVDEPGKFRPPASVLARLKMTPNVIPVKGRIEDTLFAYNFPVLLCYLDLDLHLSTKVALDWLALHLVPGGVIVVDDYATHRGIQLAVKEFLAQHPDRTRFDGGEVIEWR